MKRKILFIMPSMRGGGAERVMSTILRHWDREKWSVKLVLLQKEGAYLDTLPQDLDIIDLSCVKARYSIPKLYRLIKKEKPDIVFSNLYYMNFIVSFLTFFLPKSICWIARETTVPSARKGDEKFFWLFHFLYKICYNRFDKIICQSHDMESDLSNTYNIQKEKLKIINNPVDIQNIQERSNEYIDLPSDKKVIMASGRLVRDKGFHDLIHAAAYLKLSFRIYILGQGPEYHSLRKKIQQMGLEKQIDLLGFQNNPYKFLGKADLFVQTSYYEGFPNVLLESLACGVPVVAFNCLGDIKRIISSADLGTVVEQRDPKILAEAIDQALKTEWDRDAIKKHAKDHYDAAKITGLIENMIDSMDR
jgi:glycosyltransferase involved in cell wall biosynthesis